MAVSGFPRVLINAMRFVPEPLVWRFSKRYIAGRQLDDALHAVRDLNASGCSATIDVLGEDSETEAQVNEARDLYLQALRSIGEAPLDCGISVKLSDMGLKLDATRCIKIMRELLSCAREHGNFLRIDMEDSSVTTQTLDIYRELRVDFENVGIVLQSCLRRTAADIEDLLQDGPTDVRICKGIYIEPEAIAYRHPDEIRSSYQDGLRSLLAGGARRVAIATHDPLLVVHAKETISDLKVDKERYEFQMLLGVAERLRRELIDAGHPLRVYVPFGELWFKYSMRRLAENPNIAGHIVKNLFTRN